MAEFKCSASLGRPMARMYWAIKAENSKDFKQIPRNMVRKLYTHNKYVQNNNYLSQSPIFKRKYLWRRGKGPRKADGKGFS